MSLKSTFDAQMNAYRLPAHAPIAVGVSGGADSMALAVLLKNWAHKNAHSLVAVTVDHQLRPESVTEARFVATQMKNLGIEHHILTWEGKKPATRIEERAREARYYLLADFCARRGIRYLCIAHHSSDQAETFLSRLARGSGVDGLAAMKPLATRGNLTVLRPLLSCHKSQLYDLLISQRLNWVNDPMNEDENFERVRWRKNLKVIEQLGLPLNAINTSAKRLARAAKALQFYTEDFIQNHVTIDSRGFALINKDAFHAQPEEIRIRTMGALIETIGQSGKALPYAALEKTVERLPQKATLGSCHIISHKHGIFIAKEAARMPAGTKVKAGQKTKWDRFYIIANRDGFIKAHVPEVKEKGIPFLVQQSFPYFSLEKNAKLDYKELATYIELHIEFLPQNKG